MIEKPALESVGDVYTLTWEKSGLRIIADHIAEERHSVWAELTIEMHNSGQYKHLHQGTLNLLATQSKSSLAKQLVERCPKELDWSAIIEQMSVTILRAYREGAPVLSLEQITPRTQSKFLFYPYIMVGETSTLYGYGGSGKTNLAMAMSLAIHNGCELWGTHPIKTAGLYLDWEGSAKQFLETMNALKAGMGLPTDAPGPYYRWCQHKLSDDITWIQKEIAEKGIGFMVVDSVGMASGFGEQFHASAIEFLRAARSPGIAILCIDHKPKDTAGGIFGSIYKTNECRSTFEVQAIHEAGESTLDVAIYHKKANYVKITRPRAFRIEFMGTDLKTERINITPRDITDIPDFAKQASLKTRLLKLLLHEGQTNIADIATSLEEPPNKIRAVLSRYKEEFVNLGTSKEGLWAIRFKGKEEQ